MNKILFQCNNCDFFPLEFEKLIYFINLNVFKCPICDFQTYFMQGNHFLLNNRTYETHRKLQQKLEQTLLNNKIKPSISHTLIIQKNIQLNDILYIKPLNPQIAKKWHLNIQELLLSGDYVFFRSLYKILKSQKRVKQRKVTKLQYLLYCLDTYINLFLLDGKSDESKTLVNVVIIGKDNNKIKMIPSLSFTLSQYKTYQAYLKSKVKQNESIIKSYELKLFERKILDIIQFIQSDDYVQQSSKNVSDLINKQLSVKVSLFLYKFDENFIKKNFEQIHSDIICFYFKNEIVEQKSLNGLNFQLIPTNVSNQTFESYLKHSLKNKQKQSINQFVKKKDFISIYWRCSLNIEEIKMTKIQGNNFIDEISTFKLNSQNFHKIIRQNLSKQIKIKCQDIEIQRIICKSDDKIFVYVFNFDQLISENYQELDCTNQDPLSILLRTESKQYIQTKQTMKSQQNPFKKKIYNKHIVKEIIQTYEPIFNQDQFQCL